MMNGKGIFIWQSKNVEGGVLSSIVKTCQVMGLSWVALKIGDSVSTKFASFLNMPEAVAAFRAAGISVWGWHYVYGGIWIEKNGTVHTGGPSPAKEAAFAVRQVKELGLDGYIIDAEREWKVEKPGVRSVEFMGELKDIGVPVALCSYRFPSLHREFPWEAFLAGCEFHMPQVYWGPGRQIGDFDQSCSELLEKAKLPIVPVGRAYIGDGHPFPTSSEITQFTQRAEDRGCPGVSYWALDFLYLHTGGFERMKAISDFKWQGRIYPPPPPTPIEPLPKVIGIVRVLANKLNIRSAPSINGTDIGDLVKGAEMYAFKEQNGWAMIGDDVWICTGANLAEWTVRNGH